MNFIRIILLIATVGFGVAWAMSADFIWYGLLCIISAFLLLCTLGSGSSAGDGVGWTAMDFGGGDGGGGDGGGGD